MTELKTYTLGPPFKGMATQIDPILAGQQGYFANVTNVTYDEVAARPMPKPMQEVAQIPLGQKFLFHHYGAAWISDSIFTPSGIYNWGIKASRSSKGFTVSYVTATSVLSGNFVYAKPKRYHGLESPVDMGIAAPTAAPTATNGTGGNITVAYTHVAYDLSSFNGLVDNEVESNPSKLYPDPTTTTTLKDGGTVTFAWPSPANARVTVTRIYATQAGDPSGTLYWVGDVSNQATTTFSLSGKGRDTGKPLNWGVGGSPEDDGDAYFDHSPPGKVTCFSDRFHGTEANSTENAGGTLFYAEDNVVGWTETGKPEYFPAVNKYILSGTVQAIVSIGTQTFAFLTDQIWAFSGQYSSAISARQISTRRGVGIGKAKTVQSTPYGVVYASREGLVLFDGSDARLICQEVFREFPYSDHLSSAYIDGIYYLSSDGSPYSCYRIDLRNPDNITVTKTDVSFSASCFLQADLNLSPKGVQLNASPAWWDSATSYVQGSVVKREYGNIYSVQPISVFCSTQDANAGNDPTLRDAKWALVPDGRLYLALVSFLQAGDDSPPWSSTQTYQQDDVVTYNGARYTSISASANINHTPSPGVTTAWWTPGGPYSVPVCPYTEDPQVNKIGFLPITMQTHPIRLGPINSISKLRRFRLDGSGTSSVTFSFDDNASRSYTRSVTASNSNPARHMLPASMYGDYFTLKVESSQEFSLRQVEAEGATNR